MSVSSQGNATRREADVTAPWTEQSIENVRRI
jgi:hypothetical protein